MTYVTIATVVKKNTLNGSYLKKKLEKLQECRKGNRPLFIGKCILTVKYARHYYYNLFYIVSYC